ncbi:hypothetical protein QAD02_007883 [Eretmocerus hayati]|uniref:Uncharacterized protein n=1 Tax=Eretmocerus hayati TaxID=131215 RepID=A0ACC2N6A9_9HYME|nr:hypothetical protein QAD02_007883 [Eretmocerus hayati]
MRGITRNNEKGQGTGIDNRFGENTQNLKVNSHRLIYELTDHDPILFPIFIKSSVDVKSEPSKVAMNFKTLHLLGCRVNWSKCLNKDVIGAVDMLVREMQNVMEESTKKVK